MIDVVEILEHWHAGRSKSQVAASVGVDRATVRKYVAPAEAAAMATRLSKPGYYQLGFSAEEEAVIAEETGTVAAALGYQ